MPEGTNTIVNLDPGVIIDSNIEITSIFDKLLTGLTSQKGVNDKLDELITEAAADPTVNSDAAHGYYKGCIWINGSKIFVCRDATTGAALWTDVTISGAEAAAAYRDFTDQSSDPSAPSAGVHRIFTDVSGQIFSKDSTGSKIMIFPSTLINNIGVAGQLGYGVGICPPDILAEYNVANPGEEIRAMNGTYDIASANYGNYQVSHDGSVIVWVPFFWAKIAADNTVTTRQEGYYADEAAANAAGYILPRAFINAGIVKRGVFLDKFSPSLTGITASDLDAAGSLAGYGIFSSIKGGNPISSAADSLRKLVTAVDNEYAGSFSNCRENAQSPANAYYGGIDAVKSRGDDYHVWTAFERQLLWLLSRAHKAASVGTTYCAWNGVAPYAPKGNNYYGVDYNDSGCTFEACDDEFWGNKTAPGEARKAGGGTPFARTTHNGQNSGICDINGNQYMMLLGVTSIAESAQAIAAIDRAAQCTVTVTNAAAAKSNYANGKPVMITGSLTGEWATLLKDKIFTISDLSGNTFKIKNQAGAYVNTSALTADYASGLSSTTGKFYVLKESIDVKAITSGASGATDHWGATGVAAMFDEIDLDLCGAGGQRLGNGANQVFSGETDRTSDDYKRSAALLVKDKNSTNTSGTTELGNDYFYIYILDNLALLAFCIWGYGSGAGVGASDLSYPRTAACRGVSVRAGLYL